MNSAPTDLHQWAGGWGKRHGWGGGRCKGKGFEGGYGGGPKRLIVVLKMMRENQCLSTDAVAALVLQWLPMITQRAVRKMDKLSKVGPGIVSKISPAITVLAKSVQGVDGLQQFSDRLE